jgi:hypothetical protein
VRRAPYAIVILALEERPEFHLVAETLGNEQRLVAWLACSPIAARLNEGINALLDEVLGLEGDDPEEAA